MPLVIRWVSDRRSSSALAWARMESESQGVPGAVGWMAPLESLCILARLVCSLSFAGCLCVRTESESQGVPGALGWVGPLESLCSLSSAWRLRLVCVGCGTLSCECERLRRPCNHAVAHVLSRLCYNMLHTDKIGTRAPSRVTNARKGWMLMNLRLV